MTASEKVPDISLIGQRIVELSWVRTSSAPRPASRRCGWRVGMCFTSRGGAYRYIESLALQCTRTCRVRKRGAEGYLKLDSEECNSQSHFVGQLNGR